jgi:hypothetical protein
MLRWRKGYAWAADPFHPVSIPGLSLGSFLRSMKLNLLFFIFFLNKNLYDPKMISSQNYVHYIGFIVKPMHFGGFSFNLGVNKGSELIKCIGFIVVTYASV